MKMFKVYFSEIQWGSFICVFRIDFKAVSREDALEKAEKYVKRFKHPIDILSAKEIKMS